jgi:hypothetical protein
LTSIEIHFLRKRKGIIRRRCAGIYRNDRKKKKTANLKEPQSKDGNALMRRNTSAIEGSEAKMRRNGGGREKDKKTEGMNESSVVRPERNWSQMPAACSACAELHEVGREDADFFRALHFAQIPTTYTEERTNEANEWTTQTHITRQRRTTDEHTEQTYE